MDCYSKKGTYPSIAQDMKKVVEVYQWPKFKIYNVRNYKCCIHPTRSFTGGDEIEKTGNKDQQMVIKFVDPWKNRIFFELHMAFL